MADVSVEDVLIVRQLISDVGTVRLLDDIYISALLTLNANSVRLAAADALEAIAVSEVLVSKKIRTQDLASDGPAVSAELRALAASLRKRARELGEDPGAVDEDVFAVVDTIPGPRRPELTEYPSEVWGL